MSREMPIEATESFRVIVTRKTGARKHAPIAYGAFPTLAGARSVRTREINDWLRGESEWAREEGDERSATGQIQRTSTDWQDE